MLGNNDPVLRYSISSMIFFFQYSFEFSYEELMKEVQNMHTNIFSIT